MLSVLTVKGGYEPFADIQTVRLRQHFPGHEHLVAYAGRKGSRSHGPALDRLLEQACGEHVMVLDSDAFPVADIELPPKGTVVSVAHERGYAHPCFWLAHRCDLENLSFQRAGELDVGEHAFHQLAAAGVSFDMLPLTAANHTDPLLGAVYGDKVFHHWYTTRLDIEGTPDGVPKELIRASIEESLRRWG